MHSTFLWGLAISATFHISYAFPADTSTSGRCGHSFGGLTCTGSRFGTCCSKYGYCGVTSDHCDVPKGCQASYGRCTAAKVSKDGSCGGAGGNTCLNSAFGSCCSRHGFCGSSLAYCGTGCNSAYGSCGQSPPVVRSSTKVASSTVTSTHRAPSPTLKVSKNARCGTAHGASPAGMTCLGSQYGNCCSQWGYCGNGDSYCAATSCQAAFGKCDTKSSSPVIISTSSRTSASPHSTSTTTLVVPSTTFSLVTSSVQTSSSVLPSTSLSSTSASYTSSSDSSSASASSTASSSSSQTSSSTTLSSSSAIPSPSTVAITCATPFPTDRLCGRYGRVSGDVDPGESTGFTTTAECYAFCFRDPDCAGTYIDMGDPLEGCTKLGRSPDGATLPQDDGPYYFAVRECCVPVTENSAGSPGSASSSSVITFPSSTVSVQTSSATVTSISDSSLVSSMASHSSSTLSTRTTSLAILTSTTMTSIPSPTPVPETIMECSDITGCVENRICTVDSRSYQQSCDRNPGSLLSPFITYEYFTNIDSTFSKTNDIPGTLFAECATFCASLPASSKCDTFYIYQMYGQSIATCTFYSSPSDNDFRGYPPERKSARFVLLAPPPTPSSSSVPVPSGTPNPYPDCSTVSGCEGGRICSTVNDKRYQQSCDVKPRRNYRVVGVREISNPGSTMSMDNDLPGAVYDVCARACAQDQNGCKSFVVDQQYGQGTARCELTTGGDTDLPGSLGQKLSKWVEVD